MCKTLAGWQYHLFSAIVLVDARFPNDAGARPVGMLRHFRAFFYA